MNQINNNNYQQWIERFLNAETTLNEEKELYAYFSRQDLPEDARRYRSMFGWYETMPDTISRATSATPSPAKRELRILPRHIWRWAGIAAVLALLFTVGLTLRHTTAVAGNGDDDYIYASYMIRDGQKITDPEVVNAEFDRMEAIMDSYTAAIESRIESYQTPGITIETDNPEIHDFIKTSF